MNEEQAGKLYDAIQYMLSIRAGSGSMDYAQQDECRKHAVSMLRECFEAPEAGPKDGSLSGFLRFGDGTWQKFVGIIGADQPAEPEGPSPITEKAEDCERGHPKHGSFPGRSCGAEVEQDHETVHLCACSIYRPHRGITEKKPEAPEECECGHRKTSHFYGNYCMACGYILCQKFRLRAAPTEKGSAPPEEKLSPEGHAEECVCVICLPRKFAAKDAEISRLGTELRAAREEAKKAKAEVARWNDVEDQYQKTVGVSIRRAGEILGQGGYDNLDHAAERVVKQRDALKAERDRLQLALAEAQGERDSLKTEMEQVQDTLGASVGLVGAATPIVTLAKCVVMELATARLKAKA